MTHSRCSIITVTLVQTLRSCEWLLLNWKSGESSCREQITTLEFPGGLQVRILGFHCHSPGSIPGQGTEIPQTKQCRKNKHTHHYHSGQRKSSPELQEAIDSSLPTSPNAQKTPLQASTEGYFRMKTALGSHIQTRIQFSGEIMI